MAHLVSGLPEKGFVVVANKAGVGKTTVAEQLWSQLGRTKYVIACVLTNQVSADGLFRLVVANFGLRDTPGVDTATLRRFEKLVWAQRRHGRLCLLVIDEVQSLSLGAMEELRMLSNVGIGGKTSVQPILLGQPQFRRMLASSDWEQLRQRVFASYHPGPITEVETRRYILHRSYMVDWRNDLFSENSAFAAVFAYMGGISCRVNTSCSRLLLGALDDAHRITASMVDDIADERRRDLGAGLVAGASVQNAGALSQREVIKRVERMEQHAVRQVLKLLETNGVGRE